jgi:hypothetical protein
LPGPSRIKRPRQRPDPRRSDRKPAGARKKKHREMLYLRLRSVGSVDPFVPVPTFERWSIAAWFPIAPLATSPQGRFQEGADFILLAARWQKLEFADRRPGESGPRCKARYMARPCGPPRKTKKHSKSITLPKAITWVSRRSLDSGRPWV